MGDCVRIATYCGCCGYSDGHPKNLGWGRTSHRFGLFCGLSLASKLHNWCIRVIFIACRNSYVVVCRALQHRHSSTAYFSPQNALRPFAGRVLRSSNTLGREDGHPHFLKRGCALGLRL